MTKVIVGDVETTGTSTTDKVVEIAWAEINENFEVLNTTRALINPEKPIPSGASAVHGISNDDVKDCPPIDVWMADQGYPLAGDEYVLVSHNVPFDQRYFKPWMPEYMGGICTLKLARKVYEDADNHKLQTLKWHLNLDVDVAHHEAHTALADVKVCLALLKRLNIDTGWDIFEMFDFCNTPQEVIRIGFGKHKGTKLKDLPPSYIRWLLALDNLDEDLRFSLQKL